MAESKQPLIKVTDLMQVCIVVNNIDKSMEAMWNNFGIGPWDVVIADADTLSDTTYYGKPARFGFKAALTQKMLGGIEIELIEPLEGENMYCDFLREYGEGVQHIGHYRVDSLETLTETTRKLAKAGFPCIMSGRTPIGNFAYMDTRKILNTVLEMSWTDPSVTAPPPAYVFPK